MRSNNVTWRDVTQAVGSRLSACMRAYAYACLQVKSSRGFEAERGFAGHVVVCPTLPATLPPRRSHAHLVRVRVRVRGER